MILPVIGESIKGCAKFRLDTDDIILIVFFGFKVVVANGLNHICG
jgi:hypothetical protein